MTQKISEYVKMVYFFSLNAYHYIYKIKILKNIYYAVCIQYFIKLNRIKYKFKHISQELFLLFKQLNSQIKIIFLSIKCCIITAKAKDRRVQ